MNQTNQNHHSQGFGGIEKCPDLKHILGMSQMQVCELCRREVRETTEHHLIPRARHKVYKKRKDFDMAVLHRTISVCKPCHKNVHALFTEKELAETYYTVELLLAHPDMQKFTEWVSKRPDMHLRVRRSNAKGGK